GRDGLDPVSQRPHETLYRLAHRLIVVDDRNQRLCLWHSTSRTRACDSNEATRSEALERRVKFTTFQEDETNSRARRLYLGLDRAAVRVIIRCTGPRFVSERYLGGSPRCCTPCRSAGSSNAGPGGVRGSRPRQ